MNQRQENMLTDFFIKNVWASVGVWLLLSISDSLLTVKAARMYQKGVKEHFDFSGSIELEPAHQEEIDKFQAISFRYVLELVLFGGLLWIVHNSGLTNLFSVFWGGLVLLQLTIHLDHFRNLTLFRYASRSIGIQGHIQYARWLTLRLSSIKSFGFSLMFSMVYLFSDNLVILGGAISCLLMALRHLLLSKGKAAEEELAEPDPV
jgi:hypothetical protein